MKDAFWTAGSPKYAPYDVTRRAIVAKIENEKPKPPPAPAARACKSCGRITINPCL
jgi:hypothetical protein